VPAAPKHFRHFGEIAGDIAKELDADDVGRQHIHDQLSGLAQILHGLHHIKDLGDFKRRVERILRELEKLRGDHLWLGVGLRPIDDAISSLMLVRKMDGPPKQANPFILPCLTAAAHMIRTNARKKKVDQRRLGIVAGYVYEAIAGKTTGKPDKTFGRACREFCTKPGK